MWEEKYMDKTRVGGSKREKTFLLNHCHFRLWVGNMEGKENEKEM